MTQRAISSTAVHHMYFLPDLLICILGISFRKHLCGKHLSHARGQRPLACAGPRGETWHQSVSTNDRHARSQRYPYIRSPWSEETAPTQANRASHDLAMDPGQLRTGHSADPPANAWMQQAVPRSQTILFMRNLMTGKSNGSWKTVPPASLGRS